jgi:hypothetical protein
MKIIEVPNPVILRAGRDKGIIQSDGYSVDPKVFEKTFNCKIGEIRGYSSGGYYHIGFFDDKDAMLFLLKYYD